MDTAEIKRPNQNDALLDRIMAGHRKLSMKRTMTVRREEYLDHMTFKANVRTLFREHLGPFVGLKEEWKAQGASDAELDFSAFHYCEPLFYDCGIFTGYYGPDLTEIISDDDEAIVYRDFMGVRTKIIKASSTLGHPLEFPVSGREDWGRLRPFYQYCEGRVPPGMREGVGRARAEGCVITASIPGGYDEIRVLLGDEGSLIGPYTEPELIHDILSTIGDTVVRVLGEALDMIAIDQINIHEDMAGKGGPLWGPKQVDEFMVPYYRRCIDAARAGGARLFNVDSDGDCGAIIPSFIEGGVNMFHPCEPAAGMDMVELRRRYGTKLALEGGIDKHALRRGLADIDAELEYRVPPMVRTGGCVLGLDHRIPNGVPIENYRHYLKRLGEIVARERGKMAEQGEPSSASIRTILPAKEMGNEPVGH
jgi:hypothetical protein